MQLIGRELGFRYHDEDWLFRYFNIQVQLGEIIGIFGPSGCGKTTLARVLAGYEQPLEGKVEIKAHESVYSDITVEQVNPVQLVFQHPEQAINPLWRIRDVLEESWWPDESLLQSLGIESSWLQRRSRELSLGQLQRISIARALRPTTRFLIADEMTAMVDAITQVQIWQTVIRIAAKHKLGMIVISHDKKLLQRLSDQIIYWR